MNAPPTTATTSTIPWPSSTAAWYTVIILLMAYTLAYVDRAILTILVEPIQRDLGINDTQIGLLHGFAFAIFYATLGLPLGYVADHLSRKKLIVISIAVWSLMTASCGMAKSFGQLFLARIGVGVGEAGLNPASYSLIADYFPPERRSTAMGVYTIGLFFGGGCAILLGGLVVSLIGETPTVQVPLLGEMRSWQAAFLALGIPGLLVAALALTLREPRRRGGKDHAASMALSLGEQIREVRQYVGRFRRVYWSHFVGFAFLGVPFNVALLWARPYLTRQFDVGRGDAAYMIGTVMVIFATAGVLTGSFFADWLQSKGKTDATIRVGLFASILLLVPMALFPFMPTATSATAVLAIVLFFGASSYGAAPAALQLVTPNHMRAVVSAIYLFMVNIVGLTMGPTVTGFLTDYVFHDPKAVGFSVSIVGCFSGLVAAVLFALLLKPFRQAVAAQTG